MNRRLVLSGVLALLIAVSGLASWEMGTLWIYHIDGQVPPWSPWPPISLATLETVCVLGVEEGSAALGILSYTANGVRTWVARVAEGILRPAAGEWLPPAWEVGTTWTVAERVSGEVGEPSHFVMPGGEEVQVWSISYFQPDTEGPYLEVLYSPACAVEVFERWNTPVCSGTRQLVGQGMMTKEGALSLVFEGVKLLQSQGLVEEALGVAADLIELGFEEAWDLFTPSE
jgi:hypothetical protein